MIEIRRRSNLPEHPEPWCTFGDDQTVGDCIRHMMLLYIDQRGRNCPVHFDDSLWLVLEYRKDSDPPGHFVAVKANAKVRLIIDLDFGVDP